MAKTHLHQHLSRRERQILDVLYAADEATAAEVQAQLPGSPSYSTVRALLRNLVDKGHVVFRQQGARYVYRAALDKSKAAASALDRLVTTFYAGRPSEAVLNLLGLGGKRIDPKELEDIERAVKRLRGKTRERKP